MMTGFQEYLESEWIKQLKENITLRLTVWYLMK